MNKLSCQEYQKYIYGEVDIFRCGEYNKSTKRDL